MVLIQVCGGLFTVVRLCDRGQVRPRIPKLDNLAGSC